MFSSRMDQNSVLHACTAIKMVKKLNLVAVALCKSR